jgi:hypothetical protein
MRLILVDAQSDRICGDVAEEATQASAWDQDKLESFCKSTAQEIDKGRGQRSGAYDFVSFPPSEKSAGYFVFMANENGENCLYCGSCPADLAEVFIHCFYLGYVCRPQ